MSRENKQWLNRQILVGFTEQNGRPWWFDEGLQAQASTTYSGPVPRQDVLDRVFNWDAEKLPISVNNPDGTQTTIANKVAIVHGGTGHVFKIAEKGYVIHQYRDWLLTRVADILDNDELHIGSAGLLRRGAGAFVTIERPENVTSRSGMELRPRLLAASSHDSKIATTYKMVSTVVVCDNTLDMALSEVGHAYRARHTPNSLARLNDIRETLGIFVAGTEGILHFVDSLADISLTENQWEQIVERIVSIPNNALPRVRARLENKQKVLNDLWAHDPRCTPWQGSALGAFQALNTYRIHLSGSSKVDSNTSEKRFDRNMGNIISSRALKLDRDVLAVIKTIANNKTTR